MKEFSKITFNERYNEWLDIQATCLGEIGRESYGHDWLKEKAHFIKHRGMVGLSSEDKRKLSDLKDKYKGERIFIIGNGPSLNRTDLSTLKNEYTFATNRFYLMYEKIDWKPTFYTCVDRRVICDIFAEVNGLSGSTFFFDETFRGLYRDGKDVVYFNQRLRKGSELEKAFSFNAINVVFNGNTVLYYAIQLAYFMGFTTFYLIGCDLGYKVKETVVQEGEDVFKMGVAFDLKSTEDDDPNHFDPRYFGKNRLWHAPNEKGMLDDHELCLAALKSKGRSIYNATVGGELEVYGRVNFDSLFFDAKQVFTRENAVSIDETHVVANLYPEQSKSPMFMLDVGACGGGSAAHFVRRGWRVLCFEPDAKNRAVLENRFGNSDQVDIDPRAVSDRIQQGVPFFSSDESVGISGLSAFTGSHKQTDRVEVTTLTKVMSERKIDKVEFLKIDVEGFDLSVLRGFPWNKSKPKVIECEFEDRKTLKIGHNVSEVCRYLEEHGYTVYVSEWHPIVRYGVQHQWKCFFKYRKDKQPAPDSWGNLLAFLNDPGIQVLESAISCALRFQHAPKLNFQADVSQFSVRQANQLFREGDFSAAAGIYKVLLQKGDIYNLLEFNYKLCQKRMAASQK